VSNPFTPRRHRDLKSGEPTTEILRELWSFYQFMISDDEVSKKFEAWKTFETLKRENEL
jgi:hypothetical protein